MARWSLGIIFCLLIVVAWAADPRGSARSTGGTQILDTIPADAVFYLGNNAGGDAIAESSRLALMPWISGLDSGMRKLLDQLQRENTPGQPTAIALGTNTTSSVNPVTDIDVFQLPLVAGDDLRVPFARLTGGGFTLQFDLYDPAGTLLSTVASTSGVLSHVVPTTGTYALGVRNPA